MRDLLRANFSRLFRSWVLLGAALVMVGGAVAICIGAYHNMVLYNEPGYTEPLDQVLFQAEQALGGAAAIVLSLFVGAEYSSGTIRNQLMVGKSRETVYFAEYLTCVVGAFILFMLPSYGVGTGECSVLCVISCTGHNPDSIFCGCHDMSFICGYFPLHCCCVRKQNMGGHYLHAAGGCVAVSGGEVLPGTGARALHHAVGSRRIQHL